MFGEARWSPLDRVQLTAGVRGERIHRDALPGDPLAFTPRPDFPAETIELGESEDRRQLARRRRPRHRAPRRACTAPFGTGIRPPDAFEIAFTDNSGLKPERSRSADIGVEQALAGGGVQVDATAFFNRYDDLIISVGRSFAGSSRWRTDNISNARARGARALGGVAAGARRRPARPTYTFLDSEILAVDDSSEAPPPYAVGDPLLRRPRQSGQRRRDRVRTSRWSAFAQVLVRGETLDAEPAFGPTGGLYSNDGYAVTNLGGTWRRDAVGVRAGRVLNLFEREYEEVLGYPSPGRTAYVGVRVAAGR